MIDVTLTVEDNSTIGLLRLLLLVLFMLRRGFYNLLMITDSFNTIFILSQLGCSLYLLRQIFVEALSLQDGPCASLPIFPGLEIKQCCSKASHLLRHGNFLNLHFLMHILRQKNMKEGTGHKKSLWV